MFADNTARKTTESAKPPAGAIAPKTGSAPATEAAITIESRFGTIEIAPESRVSLPNGLLGFGEFHDFGLASLPDGRHPQFRILQCLDAAELSFLVAPLNMESGAISESDLNEACTTLEISRERLAILLIVTVRRDDAGAHVSVNMRAPLFIDTARNIGRQYVMPNNKYSIRHAL